MVSAGDFRKGLTIEIDGTAFVVVDFQHVKPGKGAAFVRTKIKNVITGAVLERTFNPSDKMPKANLETKKMQYLYNEDGLYYFMDNETYEQLPLNKSQIEEALPYIKENDVVTIKFFKGNPFSVEPENFVELKIIECEPAVRGDTATNATKLATLETGFVVTVPMFIEKGESIRVDTRSGEYMERIK
ncbi:MAG: elongation factor P [Clostridia bacterium]|nr:elongation factor P [Clostridia bacterium]